MRKFFATMAAGALALSLAGCGGDDGGSGGDAGTIGVAMPTKSSERWIADGNNIKKQLEARRLQGRPAVRRGRHPHPGLRRSRT